MIKQPYVIVVGVDFEASGDRALDAAMHFAAGVGDAEVHAVHVSKNLGAEASRGPSERPGERRITTSTAEALDELERRCRERLNALLELRPEADFRRLVTHYRLGKPADQIIQLAISLDADLIVVGTHNREGLERLVVGSVAERVVRAARCPVFVVRPKRHPASEPLESSNDGGTPARHTYERRREEAT